MTTFLADFDWSGSAQVAIPVVAVTLSLCIPIVAIIVDHFQKKAKMRLVEKAIEHGVDISDINFDGECKEAAKLPYRDGMVTMAVGIGLLVAGRYLSAVSSILVGFAMVGGAICLCVGVALLVNDWMNRDRFRQSQQPPGTSGPVDLSR